jgi:hypothetical protein
MRSPADMSCIQIEITNKCTHRCNSCTRFVGHHCNTFFMDLEQIEQAIDSLKGFDGTVGIMGGEPTLHPQFPRILDLLRAKVPKEKRQLWTSGYKWDEYYDDIHRTFLPENISYNDHSEDLDVRHQPLLIAINEVVEDDELMFQLISNCWVQNRWSASINTNGAFMCEVAGAMSYLFPWNFGIDVTPRWWKITPDDELFKEQVMTYCLNCSGCLPVPFRLLDEKGPDLCSPLNYKRIKDTTKKEISTADISQIREYLKGKTAEPGEEKGSLKDFPEWHPWRYKNWEPIILRDENGKIIN